jgi:hypothetical protein
MEVEPIPFPVKRFTFLEYLGIYPLFIKQYILKKGQTSKNKGQGGTTLPFCIRGI